MPQLKLLGLTGFLFTCTGLLVSATAQPAPIQYKIVWNGSKNTALTAAYAVFQEDGTTTSKAVSGQFPMSVELSVAPTATVSASGSSPVDAHVRVRIYRNGKVCDEAVSYGIGNFATATCSGTP
jgi:hypothetical protein